jgi:hypothetical protein
MPEMGQSGSEGGVALTTPSLPLSKAVRFMAPLDVHNWRSKLPMNAR